MLPPCNVFSMRYSCHQCVCACVCVCVGNTRIFGGLLCRCANERDCLMKLVSCYAIMCEGVAHSFPPSNISGAFYSVSAEESPFLDDVYSRTFSVCTLSTTGIFMSRHTDVRFGLYLETFWVCLLALRKLASSLFCAFLRFFIVGFLRCSSSPQDCRIPLLSMAVLVSYCKYFVGVILSLPPHMLRRLSAGPFCFCVVPGLK